MTITLLEARTGLVLSVILLTCLIIAVCSYLWFVGVPVNAVVVIPLISIWVIGISLLVFFTWAVATIHHESL